VQEELLTFEAGFSRAVALNDVAEIGRFVADDWVIVDADGSVIGSWRPAQPDDALTVVMEFHTTDNADEAERWRLELSAGMLPTGIEDGPA
jgi:hypothetical protein